MGGHIFPTVDNATDITIISSHGLKLELPVQMQMEVIWSPSITRKPTTLLPKSQPNLLTITTLPGLERGGLTSTVTGGGAMEALGTTTTGALGNLLI